MSHSRRTNGEGEDVSNFIASKNRKLKTRARGACSNCTGVDDFEIICSRQREVWTCDEESVRCCACLHHELAGARECIKEVEADIIDAHIDEVSATRSTVQRGLNTCVVASFLVTIVISLNRDDLRD